MAASLESRVAALELEVKKLQKRRPSGNGAAGREWIEDLYGAFAGDQVFEQAMKLGRKYRRSTRPRAARKTRP